MKLWRHWDRWWLGTRVPAASINLFRTVFFALFAVDAWLQLAHAARYGADGFNVGHVPWLPAPSRVVMIAVFLLQAYFGVRAALGAATAWSVRALTVLFGYGYFASQADSYQHHYLVFLVLVCCWAIPWQRAQDEPDSELEAPGVQLLVVQLALMYAWAVVAKLDAAWLDGTTLEQIMRTGWARELVVDTVGWQGASHAVAALEAALTVGLFIPRARPLVFVAGLAMHVAFGASALDIGQFSWLMAGVYAVLVPPRWLALARGHLRVDVASGAGLLAVALGWDTLGSGHWIFGVVSVLAVAAAAGVLAEQLARRAPRPRWLEDPTAGRAALAAAALASALALAIPLEGTIYVAALAALALAALGWRAAPRAQVLHAAAHVAAFGTLLTLHATTDEIRDHYAFWGGDARRRDDLATATAAYTRATEVSPRWAIGHVRLADLYLRDDRRDDALREYLLAGALDPDEVRAFMGQAELHDAAGNGAAAAVAAERALAAIERRRQAKTLQRGDARSARRAQAILQKWEQRTP